MPRPPLPEHAGRVRVIDHHDAIEFFGEAAQFGERRNVAVHGKHAVGDQQFVAGPVFGFLAEALAIGDVPVLEHLDRGARKPAAVDDGCVIQFIGENQIVFAENRGDGSGVGREAGLKNDACFRSS